MARRSYRERYFANYTLEKRLVGNKKGYRNVYVYRGALYRWNIEGENLKRRKIIYGVLFAVSATVFAAAAVMDSPANLFAGTAFVSMMSIIALLFLGVNIVKFIMENNRMTEFDCLDVHKGLIASALIHSIAMSIASASCLYATARSGFSLHNLLTMGGYLLCGGCSALIWILQRGLTSHLLEEE